MLKKSKWFISGVIFTLILMCIVTASSEDIFKEISVIFNNIKIVLNGEELHTTDVNGKEVEPFIYEGTTYVPIRAVAEAFGKDVTWSDEEQKVKITDPVVIEEDGSNLFVFREDNLFGYMDINGNIRIEPQFYNAREFSEGLAVVEKYDFEKKVIAQGVIDINGNLVVPFTSAIISDFHEGYASVLELPYMTKEMLIEHGLEDYDNVLNIDPLNFLEYYIDRNGNKAFNKTFWEAYDFSCGLALVNLKQNYDEPNRYTYIDKTGEIVTDIKNEEDFKFYQTKFSPNGYMSVVRDGKSEVINTEFKTVFSLDEYNKVPYFNDEGYAVVIKDGKYGVINEKNEIIINFEYDLMLDYGDGLYPAAKNGKWGYIDINNDIILPFEYVKAYKFYDGLAIATRADGKKGLINKKGEFVFESEEDIHLSSENGMYYFGEHNWYRESVQGVEYTTDDVTYINKNHEIVVPHY